MTDDKVPITCEECSYEWEYGGELFFTTCPNCNSKTETPLHEKHQDGESIDELEERREELLSELVEVQQDIDEQR